MAPPKQLPGSGSKATSKPTKTAPAPILPTGVPDVQKPGATSVGPPEATYYFPIPLGGSTPSQPVTGVFLPNGFSYGNVDVILFFHGNRRGAKMSTGWFFDTIFKYWGGNFPEGEPPVLFRENLIKSTKHSVLLIAPTLGLYPGSSYTTDASSDYGIFGQQAVDAPGGFLEQVVAKLAENEPKAKGMKVGKIILAGHSGGGDPVLRQIELMQRTTIYEVWAFEAVYVNTDLWVNAIASNTDTKFYFHFATTAQRDLAREIEGKIKTKTFEMDTVQPITIDGKRYPKQRSTEAKFVDLMGGKLNVSFIEKPAAPKVGSGGDHYGALTQNFFDRLQAATSIK